MPLPPRRVLAALTRYDTKRDRETHHIDRLLPADVGVVHAVTSTAQESSSTSREPDFLDQWDPRRAACGTRIKVVLRLEFDPDQKESCRTCAAWFHS